MISKRTNYSALSTYKKNGVICTLTFTWFRPVICSYKEKLTQPVFWPLKWLVMLCFAFILLTVTKLTNLWNRNVEFLWHLWRYWTVVTLERCFCLTCSFIGLHIVLGQTKNCYRNTRSGRGTFSPFSIINSMLTCSITNGTSSWPFLNWTRFFSNDEKHFLLDVQSVKETMSELLQPSVMDKKWLWDP